MNSDKVLWVIITLRKCIYFKHMTEVAWWVHQQMCLQSRKQT